uniref:Uncharacterized protein n=1 Tax=Chromera velia CCMP2878 TaxID=1169474 RepID=A0A0G4FCV2_9ALVE|eukprot:Cvel_16406.t1-p1 / transcript=Cvel_16406.t1 / gene=Cvel_16406 / organism=Chromera_velia_CCMP2878 / gene_product=hypothetical protein / transcript_product=hypothetical protein / location=Cvel_scaffold1263:106-4012(-) / protein_length=630 / sequence_SO=supercontig / SO=protein_coding / is_pseudo=false
MDDILGRAVISAFPDDANAQFVRWWSKLQEKGVTTMESLRHQVMHRAGLYELGMDISLVHALMGLFDFSPDEIAHQQQLDEPLILALAAQQAAAQQASFQQHAPLQPLPMPVARNNHQVPAQRGYARSQQEQAPAGFGVPSQEVFAAPAPKAKQRMPRASQGGGPRSSRGPKAAAKARQRDGLPVSPGVEEDSGMHPRIDEEGVEEGPGIHQQNMGGQEEPEGPVVSPVHNGGGKPGGGGKRRNTGVSSTGEPLKKNKFGKFVCEHGREQRRCRQCGGSAICMHSKVKWNCAICSDGSRCPHNKMKYYCRECGGKGVCPHGRAKNKCRECRIEQGLPVPELLGEGGGERRKKKPKRVSVAQRGDGAEGDEREDLEDEEARPNHKPFHCIHDVLRKECPHCAPVCIHNRRRYYCKDCANIGTGGKGLCDHGKQKNKCLVCRPIYALAAAQAAAKNFEIGLGPGKWGRSMDPSVPRSACRRDSTASGASVKRGRPKKAREVGEQAAEPMDVDMPEVPPEDAELAEGVDVNVPPAHGTGAAAAAAAIDHPVFPGDIGEEGLGGVVGVHEHEDHGHEELHGGVEGDPHQTGDHHGVEIGGVPVEAREEVGGPMGEGEGDGGEGGEMVDLPFLSS